MLTDERGEERKGIDDRDYGAEQLNRMVYILTRTSPYDARDVATTGWRAVNFDEMMADIRAWHWYAKWTKKIQEQSAT